MTATFLTMASWEAAMSGEDFPTGNFESYSVPNSQSYDEGIMGFLKCDVRFGGDWDAGTNPFGAPPGLFPRDDLATVNFFTSRIDAVSWAFPYVRLRSATNGGEVHGKVTFSCSGMNQGVFSYPVNSV